MSTNPSQPSQPADSAQANAASENAPAEEGQSGQSGQHANSLGQRRPDSRPLTEREREQLAVLRRRAWRSHIEEMIQEAQREGKFDNLRGTGQPLQIEENIHAGDRALAYSLLKSNGYAPAEVERGKEIDVELRRAEKVLEILRRQRDNLRGRTLPAFASERRAYNILRAKTRLRYEDTLRAINSSILSLNIIAPPALHRVALDVAAKLREFDREFPQLKE